MLSERELAERVNRTQVLLSLATACCAMAELELLQDTGEMWASPQRLLQGQSLKVVSGVDYWLRRVPAAHALAAFNDIPKESLDRFEALLSRTGLLPDLDTLLRQEGYDV